MVVYDATSPTGLRWRRRHCGAVPPDLSCGAMMVRGYWQFGCKGRQWRNNRVVWALHHGDPGSRVVDHINGDPADNRIENLQAITQDRNVARATGSGVRKRNGRWAAQIQVEGRKRHIGTFDTEEEARAAYLSAKAVATEGLSA